MGRYLVTGGAGFIGSHLARRLLAAGHDVVVADDLSTGRRSNVPAQAGFVEVDLAERGAVSALPDGEYSGVCHLAAQSSGALSHRDPHADMQANLGSTVMLAQWCRQRGIPRFLFTSSMTVYGDAAAEPQDEEAPCRPIAYYAAAKLAAESYLRIAAMDGLEVTVARLYNVYGSGQNLENLNQGMASIYLAYLLRGEAVPVTGSLDRYRDFVHVADVVEALTAMLSLPRTPSPVYNVGTGTRTTVRDLIAQLIRAIGLPEDHPVLEQPGSNHDLFGSVARIERIGRELGWRPATPLAKGLDAMVAWARTA